MTSRAVPLKSSAEFAATLKADAAELRTHPLTVSTKRLTAVADHIETVAEFLERSHNDASTFRQTARS